MTNIKARNLKLSHISTTFSPKLAVMSKLACRKRRVRSASFALLLTGAASVACATGSGANAPRAGSGGSAGAGGASGSNTGGAGGGRANSSTTGVQDCPGGAAGMGAAGSAGAAAGAGGVAGNGEPRLPWDWAGVIGTGQSLAVGEKGRPVKSTTQPYQNLKLSTGSAPWPLDSEDESFEMVPLIEPVGRLATSYPSSYPTNISGETPHASMANQISALALERAGVEHLGVHGEFGENGQCLRYLIKGAAQDGVNGRAYEATLVETEAITRLAEAAGKSYGIGALIVTHGECDAGNGSYASELYQLLEDYNSDLSAITGQSQRIQMLVSQQNSINNRAASTLAQWQIGVEHPDDVVCVGPKYQYPYADDNVHMVTHGYQLLGEKYGQVYFERVVMQRHWQPLQPERVSKSGRVITVDFHVPVPPLTWDTSLQAPHQDTPEWMRGNGFEVRAGARRISIESVEISCNSVRITCDEELPDGNLFVGYALTAGGEPMSEPFTGTLRWGLLRDSDPFVGSVTQEPQPNYGVAFELPVP